MGGILTSLLNSGNALRVYGDVFNTIQANIANANTPGYAKQEPNLVTASGPTGGVLLESVVSSRSQFLEQAVRTQQGQLGASSQKSGDLTQIQSLFDVSGTTGVPGALSDFFNSFSQLAVNPNDQVSRQSTLTAASKVAQAFRQNATGIQNLSRSIDQQTSAAVTTINQIAAQLQTINQNYRTNPQLAQDPGLEAQANAALESLSQVVNFSTIRAPDGTYSVSLGGQTPLVLGKNAYPISADISTPQIAIRDSQGNDITPELQGTGGSLGSLLTERNVTLPGYQASLNTLAQGFADTVNTALSQGLDATGNAPVTNLFTYNATLGAAYTLGTNNLTTDQLAAAAAGAPGGNGNAIAISQLATQPVINGLTVTQAYGKLAGQVGSDIADATQEKNVQQDLVTQAQQQRAQVSGVSLDEEAVKLVQFQQSYQAMGKLVGVLDTLTTTLMNMIAP